MKDVLVKESLDNLEVQYFSTKDIYSDVCNIIESARNYAYNAVNVALIERNWLLGYRIAEEELNGKDRADYGKEIIKNLSKRLISKYGKGFEVRELYKYLQFYKMFPKIVDSVSPQFRRLLSWTHYRTLLRVEDGDARNWYEKEALNEMWSVRTLERNIATQYYFRMLSSFKGDTDNKEEKRSYEDNKLEFIKNPVITEFLGLPTPIEFHENDLENSIISNLQTFMMEFEKGYAFVARQKYIKTEKEDYFIDLVFYNYILKCFVLVDLKMGKIRHQDIGQMDMYVRMYDELIKKKDDNPTIGILLCTETDDDIARFSVLHGNEQLFATKYIPYMPTEEELRREIEKQKEVYYLQQNAKKKIEKMYKNN
jgi:predicted nuclease of restriction endonuclease-like (RecB) superfamily